MNRTPLKLFSSKRLNLSSFNYVQRIKSRGCFLKKFIYPPTSQSANQEEIKFSIGRQNK